MSAIVSFYLLTVVDWGLKSPKLRTDTELRYLWRAARSNDRCTKLLNEALNRISLHGRQINLGIRSKATNPGNVHRKCLLRKCKQSCQTRTNIALERERERVYFLQNKMLYEVPTQTQYCLFILLAKISALVQTLRDWIGAFAGLRFPTISVNFKGKVKNSPSCAWCSTP